MSLQNLPYELIMLIADVLPDHKCLNFLSQSCKRFYQILEPRWEKYAVEDKDDWKALSWAIRRKDNHFVKYLIGRNSVDINHQDSLGLSPLHWGVRNGDESSVVTTKLLLSVDADMTLLDNAGLTPLQWAVVHNPPIVKILLEKEATVEKKAIDILDRSGQTALHRAATRADVDLVRQLIKAGANVNIACLLGRTPLMWAASKKSLEVIKILVEEEGADVHHITDDKRNVLHLASTEGTIETVNYFVGKGVDITAADNQGRTPLHWAAAYGNGRTFRALLRHGADPKVKNLNGQLVNDWGTTFTTIGDALRDMGILVPKPPMKVTSGFMHFTRSVANRADGPDDEF
ncbi:uncharacterized protein H6S33_001780 [Morchella sextelata]|uniref:uncharacterized protein n=1 Tax=Morchella sextelata TaxID=1174677 RepID=UPI001D037400|nr:uncharacterized protein H6S33_001780 [Morchella sextelata]KAH0608646.1 hypothetical protein H6S33_001780 [Morchella sextelata]